MNDTTKLHVYVLTSDLDYGGGDYDGIRTVHATRDGALQAFHNFLDRNGFDREAAYDGVMETKDQRFIGNDVYAEDGLSDEPVLTWGINQMPIQP